MNRNLTLTTRATLATGGILLLLLWLTARPTIRATVSPLQVSVGQAVQYADSTRDAESHRWEFGNGATARRTKGQYTYWKPGVYLIRLTVDDNAQQTFRVTVRPGPPVNRRDSVVQLNGPTIGYQNEKMTFTATGGHSRAFAWRFGETGRIDSRDPTAIYSYNQPGRYTVVLTTDLTNYPLKHTVYIQPGFRKFNPPVDSTDMMGDDIRRRLQAIADGQPFNSHYYYVLNRYLCKRDYAAVQINASKVNDFYSYCMGLRFDRGVKIDEVSIDSDTLTRCIFRLNVTQHKP
ncbi:MAG: PKD domain-containing protein [Cytophagales bacterium]|nr:MAG: PKD domain-containing protein [Cytophagales bacterium]